MLRRFAEGADLFANLGSIARTIAALALAPFALYFAVVGLLTPVMFIGFLAVERDWSTAAGLLGIGLGHGLVGLFLGWFDLRLFRGTTSANRVTVLPTWMIWGFLLIFLGPLLMGMACVMTIQAFHSAMAGHWRLAVLLGAGAVGFAIATIRGFH